MNENVVILTVDSLRADILLRNTRVETPNIDQLLDDGIEFRNAIAPGPRTPSSMPAIFTGEYYSYEGIEFGDWRQRRDEIANHLKVNTTIPELFKSKGYETSAITTNPWTAEDTGFHFGFDSFYSLDDEGITPSIFSSKAFDFAESVLKAISEDYYNQWRQKKELFITWDDYFEKIEEQVKLNDSPFFAWVFALDTHQPYIISNEYRKGISALSMYRSLFNYYFSGDNISESDRKRIEEVYKSCIQSIDIFIGRLWDLCKKNNSKLIIHSDHGEALGEHNTYGHEYQLYNENIQVPLLIGGTDERCGYERLFNLVNLMNLVDNISQDKTSDLSNLCSDYVISRVESTQIARTHAAQSRMNYDPHYLAIQNDDFKYILSDDRNLLFEVGDEYTNRYYQLNDLPKTLQEGIKHHVLAERERRLMAKWGKSHPQL